ncbi:hypothetical protein [Marinoscillum sp. MHG1-6]|uniref:hypothetical protein n=1 Tax=Marinoscillum sp. MHG1-6 TaxID=2959627 RepID=UPI002157D563|nr:hypothetical protein [Marinoscillum sp. MHG1-6]
MQKKPNESFIDQYSLSFSQKVAGDFFKEKDQIIGQEILSVTPSKQINFFVLKILFEKWQEEMKQMESPYFDFKDAEVRKELITFMNVLSKKISMGQEHFQGLLKESVSQTLTLLADPSAFLKEEYKGKESIVLTEKNARNLLKYLKVLKQEITDLFSGHLDAPAEQMLDASGDYFAEQDLAEVLESELGLIASVLPVSFEDLVGSEEEVNGPVSEDDVDFEGSFFESGELSGESLEDEDVADFESSEEEDLEEDFEEEKARAFEEQDEDESDLDDEESEEQDEMEVSDESDIDEDQDEALEDDVKPLNEALAEEPPKIVNQAYEKQEKVTLAESMEHSKVSSIMQAISVNNKFMFVKELFDDEREVFEEAVEMIEGCSSFDDAVELLVQDYAKTYEWDMNSDVVKELLKVVFRKFR